LAVVPLAAAASHAAPLPEPLLPAFVAVPEPEPSSSTTRTLLDRDSFEIKEIESNVAVLQEVVRIRRSGFPLPPRLLEPLMQLQRTFPRLVVPNEATLPAAQVAPRWADFERQCFTACSRLEERLLRLRGVIAPAASGRPSGPQLTTAWGLDAPAHEAELARISGPPVATIKRCVLLHLNSLRHFFCHFVDPIPEGTFLQVYYGGALARPDVPTSAPFLTSLGPGGVRFRHCGVSDAACVEAINRIWTEADQEYAPAVPFVLICAHDLYFRLAKQFPSGRSVRHLNPKSLPLPAILTEVAGRPQPNP
jgi:hypothetical protein